MTHISEKQLAANRANALKSTGPKSVEGKGIVRANATRHGLSGSTPISILMPAEDAGEWQEFESRLREALNPVGEMEELLAERIASYAWRLRRAARVEEGLFAHSFYEKLAQDARQEVERQSGFSEVVAQVLRAPVDTTKHQQATAQHQEMIAAQQAATGAEATGFLQDAQTNNAFSKLSRYEAGLERSFYKTLDELKKLQRLRRNRENTSVGRRVIR